MSVNIKKDGILVPVANNTSITQADWNEKDNMSTNSRIKNQPDTLKTLEEINSNVNENSLAAAIAVKEGFEQVNESLNTTNSNVTQAQSDITTLKTNLNQVNSSVSTIQEDLNETNTNLNQTNTDLSKVQEEVTQVQEDLTQVSVSVLDTHEEIMSNTEVGKPAGALGVKEGFEKINEELSQISVSAGGNQYKDITADFDDGTFSANLSNYRPGNYIKKVYNDVTYVAVLADCNTFYNPGRADYANVNTDHWTAIVFGFTAGQMNSENTTANGFTGSAMNTWLKGECTNIVKAAFGENHLIAHQCLLSTGTYNASSATHGFSWAWEADHYTMLMSEAQLGYRGWSDLGWSTGEAHRTLDIFRNETFTSVLSRDYGQSNNNFNSNHAWLRDISAYSPGSVFCSANYYGLAGYSGASDSRGRFPIIILK